MKKITGITAQLDTLIKCCLPSLLFSSERCRSLIFSQTSSLLEYSCFIFSYRLPYFPCAPRHFTFLFVSSLHFISAFFCHLSYLYFSLLLSSCFNHTIHGQIFLDNCHVPDDVQSAMRIINMANTFHLESFDAR